ncbi:MAG: O-methyltransferase [Terriglobales bacterium]
MILDPGVEAYLYGLLPPSGPVLEDMEAQAKERQIPIVGPLVARTLALVCKLVGARRVFELGSAIGYSTLWWAAAVGESGEVFYTDSSAANAKEARGYFERAGLAGRIRILQGDALTMLAATPGEFDIVFVDLDKPGYPEALRQAVPRVRRGGLLVADNVLWSGKVAAPVATGDESTRAIVQFNRELYADAHLEPVILPLRDGVVVARKIA